MKCKREDCVNEFIPNRSGRAHVYCSRECYAKVYNAAYHRSEKRIAYKKTEEYREKARAYSRAYYHSPENKWRHSILLRLRKYGLTDDQYRKMLSGQRFKCPICLRGFDNKISHRRPCIDHCHQVGHVRGILCHDCNRAIGMLGNSSARAKRAAEYLDREIIFNGLKN